MGNRRKNTYVAEGHTLLPAIVDHAESDVFVIHSITQSDLGSCCDPDAVPLRIQSTRFILANHPERFFFSAHT